MDEEERIDELAPSHPGQLQLWSHIRPLQPRSHRTTEPIEQLTSGQRAQRDGLTLRALHNAEKRGHGPRRHNQPTGTQALYYGD